MTTSQKFPDDQPPSRVREPNAEEIRKLIGHWLETDDQDNDTSEWDTLKELLDQDRLSERKFFPNE